MLTVRCGRGPAECRERAKPQSRTPGEGSGNETPERARLGEDTADAAVYDYMEVEMVKNPFGDRLRRLRGLMEEQELDAFFVSVPENRYYVSGYEAEDHHSTETSGYVLVTASDQYLLTDFRYEEQAKRESAGFRLVIYSQGPGTVLRDVFTDAGCRRVGFEGHHLVFKVFREVEEALKAVSPSGVLEPFENLVEQLRVVKDAFEVERIRTSLALAERVLEDVWVSIRPGVKEKEIAWEIERLIRERGGDGISFPSIVAAGANGAMPHAVPTDREIEGGEAVTVDMGAKLDRYCSDITRTKMPDNPDPRLLEIYRIVREAQLAAQDAVRAGMNSMAVDAAARDLISGAGYGDQFGHGLGHGVGLAVHEPPGLRKSNGTVLKENMIVTIEPGIYLPGFGGVRLENMVRVTGSGCEVLNTADLFYNR